jgi:S1-C subfamily serine protease
MSYRALLVPLLSVLFVGCSQVDEPSSGDLQDAGFNPLSENAPVSIRRFWHQAAMIPIDGPTGYVGGSGIVFYANESYAFVLTNHHVSREGCADVGAPCEKLDVRFGFYWNEELGRLEKQSNWNGEYGIFENPVLAYDSASRDMSVLMIDLSSTPARFSFENLELVKDLGAINQGEPVAALGFPIQSYRDEAIADVVQVWSAGSISGMAFDTQIGEASGNFLVHNSDLLPGMSGGGIFNGAGQLIAIQQSILRTDSTGNDFSYDNITYMFGMTFDAFEFDPASYTPGPSLIEGAQ